MWADVGADLLDDFRCHCVSDFMPGFQCDVGVNGVAFDVVLVADDGGFGDGGVAADGALDFGGSEVVPADDDDVIDTAGDPVVAVVVSAAAVAAEISAGVCREVRVEEPLLIAVDGLHLAGPASEHAEVAGDTVCPR